VRARARRPLETVAMPRGDDARPERGQRQRRSALTGPVRATDAPSPVLQRAAEAEHAYVMKDARRLGLVAAIMLGLLVVSGLAVDRLL
jgi:hypothetical protein